MRGEPTESPKDWDDSQAEAAAELLAAAKGMLVKIHAPLTYAIFELEPEELRLSAAITRYEEAHNV